MLRFLKRIHSYNFRPKVYHQEFHRYFLISNGLAEVGPEGKRGMGSLGIQQVKPVIQPSVRGLCIKPYPLHKKGCPNFNKRFSCPPRAGLLTEFLDFTKPIYCIYNAYDIGKHVEKMKLKHPTWSERQLYNCLYWQGTARKQLRQRVKAFLKENVGLYPSYCPEAGGINITETMKQIGVTLEWPPKHFAYQVALVGSLAVKEEK